MSFWQVIAVIAAGPALGVGLTRLTKVALRKVRNDHTKRPALWNRFYALDWGDTTTNNYGYAPADGDHPQRFQHQMYLQLLNRLREEHEVRPGMKLLEVSCGRGGGLNAFLSRVPEIEATGLDVAHSAVDFCRRTYGENDRLHFVQGSALALPFPDATFDVLLNVEASNDYPDRALFFREVARVLKPNGILLFADTMKQGRREGMEQELTAAGFQAEFRDITSNVAEACRLDSPRRREVIRRHAPALGRLLLSRQLHNYAAVEGSSKFDAFVQGRRTYLMTAATKA
nr:Methyltransferase domain protein [uncultured bacterium]